MNRNIELEIEKEANRLANSFKAIEELESKLDRIQDQILNLKVGIQKSQERIADLGAKQPRRDEKLDSPTEAQKKIEYNQNLALRKLQLLKSLLDQRNPDFWKSFEKVCPDMLKGIGDNTSNFF